jgi:FkbM family methyltransferase
MKTQSVKLKNGMSIFAVSDADLKGLYEKIFVNESYGKNGIQVSGGAVVFDVGANIGMFSIWLCTKAKELRVHSFEPIQSTYRALEKNVAIHCPRTTAHNVGIGSECKEIEFTHYPLMSQMSTGHDHDAKTRRLMGDGMLSSPFKVLPLPIAIVLWLLPGRGLKERFVGFLLNHILQRKKVKGKIVGLEKMIDDLGVEAVDLLKINAMGSEIDIIVNTPESVFSRIHQLIVETHDGQSVADELVSTLERRGYQVDVESEDLLENAYIHIIYAKRPQVLA